MPRHLTRVNDFMISSNWENDKLETCYIIHQNQLWVSSNVSFTVDSDFTHNLFTNLIQGAVEKDTETTCKIQVVDGSLKLSCAYEEEEIETVFASLDFKLSMESVNQHMYTLVHDLLQQTTQYEEKFKQLETKLKTQEDQRQMLLSTNAIIVQRESEDKLKHLTSFKNLLNSKKEKISKLMEINQELSARLQH